MGFGGVYVDVYVGLQINVECRREYEGFRPPPSLSLSGKRVVRIRDSETIAYYIGLGGRTFRGFTLTLLGCLLHVLGSGRSRFVSSLVEVQGTPEDAIAQQSACRVAFPYRRHPPHNDFFPQSDLEPHWGPLALLGITSALLGPILVSTALFVWLTGQAAKLIGDYGELAPTPVQGSLERRYSSQIQRSRVVEGPLSRLFAVRLSANVRATPVSQKHHRGGFWLHTALFVCVYIYIFTHTHTRLSKPTRKKAFVDARDAN